MPLTAYAGRDHRAVPGALQWKGSVVGVRVEKQ